MEEDALVAWGGGEGFGEGGLSDRGLLMDEFATDVGRVGQVGNGLVSGEGLDAEPEPLVGPERLGRARSGSRGRQRAGEGRRLHFSRFSHTQAARSSRRSARAFNFAVCPGPRVAA